MNNTQLQTAEDSLVVESPAPNNLVTLQPEMLITKAIDANVPVETMERLLAMRSELKAEQAREAFNHAMTDFQADIPAIQKTRTANTGKFKYNYADISDVQRAVAPRLKETGLSVTFETRQEGDTLNVVCVVRHIHGHCERTEFPVPIDRQARMNDTQKVGSALTYGRRYAMCAALGIVTAEDDNDGQYISQQQSSVPNGNAPHAHNPPTPSQRDACPAIPRGAPINADQHKRLEARIAEFGLDRERVKKWCMSVFKIEHFTELDNREYQVLDEKLEVFAKQMAKEEAIEEREAIQEESA